MRPYIICHMVASIDGRIDCPMVAQISGEEYYTTLESFGSSSKLSGRVTAALECTAVKEEISGMPVRDLAKSLSTKQWKAGSTPSSSIPTDGCRWHPARRTGIPCCGDERERAGTPILRCFARTMYHG